MTKGNYPKSLKLTQAQKRVILLANAEDDFMFFKPNESVLRSLDEKGLIEAVGAGFGYRHGALYKLTIKGIEVRRELERQPL